jgi:hypothetical protein
MLNALCCIWLSVLRAWNISDIVKKNENPEKIYQRMNKVSSFSFIYVNLLKVNAFSFIYANLLKVNAFSFIYANLLKVNAFSFIYVNMRKPAEARGSPRKPAEARGSPRKPAEARGSQRKPTYFLFTLDVLRRLSSIFVFVLFAMQYKVRLGCTKRYHLF